MCAVLDANIVGELIDLERKPIADLCFDCG